MFYTRRMKNFKYFFGAAKSDDLINWDRIDNEIVGITHSPKDFDSDMIYFPSVVYVPETDKFLLFYCGNEFGKTGIGYAELKES